MLILARFINTGIRERIMAQSKNLNLLFAAMLVGNMAATLQAVASEDSAAYTDEGVRLQLPDACDGGDYFLLNDGDDYIISVAGANENQALGLSAHDQQEAAVHINTCFSKVASALESGDDSLLAQLKLAKDVQYSDVVSFTNTSYNQIQWNYAVQNVDTSSAALDPTMLAKETMAGKANDVKLMGLILSEYVFEDILEGNGKDYLPESPEALKKIPQIQFN
jgi:hypothetical protein